MNPSASRRPLFLTTRSSALIVNFLAFQCGWFACVLGAAHGWPWLGTAIAVSIVALHVLRAARPAGEFKLAALAVAIGALWDSALAALGWIDFASGTFIPPIAPAWMLALWALFASTLNVSLGWLKGRWLAAALAGAVAGPLSYYAGMRLGALDLAAPMPALIALAIGWGVFTPALLAAARRFNGVEPD